MSNCMDCGGTECMCQLLRERRQLAEACRLFTQALGNRDGYIPMLGAPKTERALKLMESARVKPVYHGQEPHGR